MSVPDVATLVNIRALVPPGGLGPGADGPGALDAAPGDRGDLRRRYRHRRLARAGGPHRSPVSLSEPRR